MKTKFLTSLFCLTLAIFLSACTTPGTKNNTDTASDTETTSASPSHSQETEEAQETQETLTITSTFDSNGDLISGWYWVRDRTLTDYAAWTISGVPINTTVTFPMTVLATNGVSGGPGYDAAFLVYYGPASDAGNWQQFAYEEVTLPNVSPVDDPVG